jgi:hypothetical protein
MVTGDPFLLVECPEHEVDLTHLYFTPRLKICGAILPFIFKAWSLMKHRNDLLLLLLLLLFVGITAESKLFKFKPGN